MADTSRSLTNDEPLHVRMMRSLKERLESGEWATADQLPTEGDLGATYGVSRSTVRMALKLLESQGLVHTRRGSGTFVTALGSRVSAGLQELRSTTETIRQQGFESGATCRTAEKRGVTPEAADSLGIDPDSEVLYLERSFQADHRTVAYCYEEIIDGIFPGPYEPTQFDGSLFELLRSRGINTPAYASTAIHAVHDECIAWGEDPPAQPLYLLLRQAHFDREGAPVIYSRNYFVEGAFHFSVLRVS